MALLATNLTNIFSPEVWNKYFIEALYTKSKLISSGIVDSSPELFFAANSGGDVVNMPFWSGLPNDSGATTISKVVSDDDTVITPAAIGTGKDIAYKDFRAQSWKTAGVVKYAAGSDPVSIVLNRYVSWWSSEIQRMLLKKLSGVFSNTLSSHSTDISIANGNAAGAANLISDSVIQDARFFVGDNFSDMSGIIMHSTVYKRLETLDLITFVPNSVQNAAPIATYHGMTVLIDDTMTKTAGGVSGFVYSTFLFGQGAIGFADTTLESDTPNIELFRVPNEGTGAGSTEIITRRKFILHPFGVAFTATAGGALAGDYPSDAELATAGKWSLVYNTNNVKIARVMTNG